MPTYEDIHRDYTDTIIRVGFKDNKGNSVEGPAYVSNVTPDKDVEFMHIVDDGNDKFYVRNFSKLSILQQFPSPGLVNYKQGVVFVGRRQKRQWKKGASSNNTYVAYPRILGHVPHSWKRVVLAAYEGQYEPVEDIVEHVLATKSPGARAFAPQFFVARLPFISVPVVGYGNFAVGTVDDNGEVVLSRRAAHLVESISDYVDCKVV